MFWNDFSPQRDCFALYSLVNQTFDLVSFRKTTSEVVFTEHQSQLSTFRFQFTSRQILLLELDFLLSSVVTWDISAKSDIWCQSFRRMSTFWAVGFFWMLSFYLIDKDKSYSNQWLLFLSKNLNLFFYPIVYVKNNRSSTLYPGQSKLILYLVI